MKDRFLCSQLQQVRQALHGDSVELQDAEMTNLHNYLEDSALTIYPSFLYPALIEVLTYHRDKVLPNRNTDRLLRESCQQTIQRLNAQKKLAGELEKIFKTIFLDVKAGNFASVEKIAAALWVVVSSQRAHPSREAIKPPRFQIRGFGKQYPLSSFTSEQVPVKFAV